MSISSNECVPSIMDHAGLLGTSVLIRRVDVPMTWSSAVAADSAPLRQRISELLQYTHNNAPKDRSPEFYEGLAYALSTMEDQA